jgi:hypothetical protein
MNKNYVIYNATGEILRTGSTPAEAFDFQAAENEFIIEGIADCMKDSVDPVLKEVVVGGRPTPVPPSPVPQIATSSSIPVDQQLDLLWQAMDSGTFPKAEPFYSAIKAAKESAE